MRSIKGFLKRSTALFLAGLMVFTNMSTLQVSAEGASTPDPLNSNVWNGTAGSLIAQNYPLNDQEKAILSCTGLAGATYSVEIPGEDTAGLVTVDADAQTVTAKVYTVDGFVWEPTAAVLKYSNADGTAGTDLTVTLNKVGDNYVGNFQKPANSYRVEVTYSLLIAMEEAAQKLLLNTPYYLTEGYLQMDDAVNGSLAIAVSAMDEKMEELRALYNGIKYEVTFEGKVVASYTIGLQDGSQTKTAIGNLLADFDQNNGRSTLSLDFDAYKRAESKVQFMMEHGAEMKEHINWFYLQIATINANSQDLLDVAEQLEVLATGTGAGTIAEAKEKIDEAVVALNQKVEDGIQTEIIEPAIKKAKDDYNLDISSLRGKTRQNDAIYAELDAKRVEFENKAKEADKTADLFALMNDAANEKIFRDIAIEIRTTGMAALDRLEQGIREAYAAGDQKANELLAKKTDLDAYAVTAEEKAADIRALVTPPSGSVGLPQIKRSLQSYYNQEWKYLGKTLVKDTITAEEYKALDAAVKAAIDPLSGESLAEDRSSIAIQEKLLAKETVITAMVDQFVIYVDVKAKAVSKNAVNSTALVDLNVVSTNFPMDKETAVADVLAAITASGVENTALAQWDSFYNIGTEKYDRVVSFENTAGEEVKNFTSLNSDIRYVITYTPKTYQINETYLPAGENVTEVPYGYNWRLPRPADLSKSYDYEINGVSHRENTIFRVVENISVSRSEGKAIAAKTLAELIAASKTPGSTLSVKEKNVLNSNAFLVDTIYYRTPDSNDKLTKVTALSGNSFKLEAKPMNAGLLNSDAEWIPVTAYPVTAGGNAASFSLAKEGAVYVGTFDCAADFSSVQVVYQLSVSDLDAAVVGDLTNIADVLVKETTEQKTTLDALCTKNNFYENLGQVTATILGSVGSVVTNMTPEAKAALNALTNQCINPETGFTYLYEYLTQYKSENGGLSYYYKGDNAKNIQNQIDLVNQYLPTVWNDDPVQDYLNSMPAMAGQASKVEAVMDQLEKTDLTSINALVDTNSAYIDNLLAAVLADGTTASHTGVGDTVVLEQVLSAVAPGLTAYGVEIQVLNKNNGLVESYKSEAYRAQGNEVKAAEFEEMYRLLLEQIPNSSYYVEAKNLPASNVILTEDPAIYTCALSPVTYTVKIDGEADQILYAFDSYTVTLAGTGNPGMKYLYNIAGSKVEVFSGALENFALATTIEAMDALFGTDRELVITRQLIDTNKENLLTFVNKLNTAFANAGLTFDNKLAAAFIPLQDAEGNLSIVLRVTNNYQTLAPTSLAGEMMDLVQDLSYVGLNGSPLFGLNSENELKLYLQTIINMLVNSGLGLETISEMVDANGNIKEMTLPNATVVGAENNTLKVGNSVINNLDQLGGKLMESTMQYGVNINNATSVPFYVTYQDFDTQAELLKKAKKGAEQIIPYLNLSCKNGAINMSVNAPESVYAYMMTALLIVGEVDLETLQSYNLQEILDYTFGLIDPMFEAEGVSVDTFINTVEKTGFYESIASFDVEANRALLELIYDSLDHFYDHTSATGTSEGGKYAGVFTYDALDVLLNNKVALDDYKTMIAELESGLSVPVNFQLKNRDTRYEALVLDIYADGITNKYYMTKNAANAISTVGDGGIVVLLSDIRSDITFNHDIILNLNGYSIDGDLLAKGKVSIVDSTLATKKCGSVVGTLTTDGGDFVLGGGKYLDGAEQYLEDGYALENNIVTNGCFTITQNGEDLNVYLGTDYLSLNKSAAKIMATDLLFKLWMNYYACSQLIVDGNPLYSVDLQNVTESLDNLSVLINKGINCIDCAGATAFATQFMKDVTDFGRLAAAVENGDVLVSYTIQNAAFNPYMQFEGSKEESYFSFNVEAAANKKVTKLNILLDDDVDANHQEKICDVLNELDTIVTFHTLNVSIENITYNNAGLSAEGEAAADVEVDLSKNVNYPIIMGAILADNATGDERTQLIDAIKYYQTSNSAIALKNLLETATTAEFAAALKASKSKSFSAILSDLGLTAPDAVELEALYTIARKVAGSLIEYSKKTGNNATLSGLKVSGEYATYQYRLAKSADTYAQMTLILFAEEKAITVKDKNGLIYLNTDSLTEALANLRDGATIYVNKEVALDANVVLPALNFTLINAKNIDFNGKVLEFADGKTKMTTDQDLTAYVTSDSEIFCSEVALTKVGETFIFRLDGQRHEWEIIDAVAPDCENTGSTAGEWCKYCHKYQDGKEPQEVPATGHQYTAQVVAPTCTEDGYTLHTCQNCQDTYKTDPTDATNHEGTTQIVKGYAPTCTENGKTDGLYCTKCQTTLKNQEDIPARHTPESYAKEPTCTETGVANASICKVCGVMVDQGTEIPAKGHGVVTEDPKAATCTEDGWTSSSYCPICNFVHKKKEIIPALGHTEVIDPEVPSSCTVPGLSEGSHCGVCGTVLVPQTDLPLANHTPVTDPEVPSSCTVPGLSEGSHCGVCGKVLVPQTDLPLANHKPVTDPEVPSSCTVPGLSEGSHCGVCGKVLVPQTDLPLANHKPVTDPAQPPTADATGLTEGSHCGVCGKVLVPQKELAKLPVINVPQVTVDATDGIVRGAKVDTANKRIYLDVSPNGFKVKEFAEVHFKIDNATETRTTICKYNTSTARGQDELVCTGDTVTVWATNKDGKEVSVSYNIIIMGDSNCDGKLNARDLVLMKLSFVGDLTLGNPGALAADMNFDGKLNARDTVACDTKYVLWAENGYVSQTK